MQGSAVGLDDGELWQAGGWGSRKGDPRGEEGRLVKEPSPLCGLRPLP